MRLGGSLHLAGPQVLRGQGGGSDALYSRCFTADKSCKKFREELGWGQAGTETGWWCARVLLKAAVHHSVGVPAAQAHPSVLKPLLLCQKRNYLCQVTSAAVLDERWDFHLRESPSAAWDVSLELCPQSQAQGTWAGPALSTAWISDLMGRFICLTRSQIIYLHYSGCEEEHGPFLILSFAVLDN